MSKTSEIIFGVYAYVEHRMGKTRFGSVLGFILYIVYDIIILRAINSLKGKNKMSPLSFQKSIVAGPVQFDIAVADGHASLKVSAGTSVGGGKAADVLKFKTSAEVDLDDRVAADLAFALLAAKFPSMAGEIKMLQTVVDAQLGGAETPVA